MSERRFHPWVGPLYDAGLRDGLRTLIVGESHYDSEDGPDLTRWSIDAHLAGGNWRFNRTVEAIAPGLSAQFESRFFWERVAFVNMVQTVMIDIRERPNADHGMQGWRALRRTIDELKPDVMMVFSRFAWDHCPYELDSGPRRASKSMLPGDGSIYLYDRRSNAGYPHNLLAAGFRHPSRLGASIGVWRVFAEHMWQTAKEVSPAAGRDCVLAEKPRIA